jgi:hypothetical protein
VQYNSYVNQTLSILDTNDLTSAERALRFAMNRDLKEIKGFVDGVRQAMLDEARVRMRSVASVDDANYLPGSSFRGDGGCLHWNCRLPKVRRLARYIALYCDSAVIPIRMPDLRERCDHNTEAFDRLHALSVILGFIELRPLVEAGLATFVPEELHFCRRHWNEAVPEYERILRAARNLARTNAGRFSISYYPAREPIGRPSLHYKGPEEYLEHGEIRRLLDSVPEWLPKAGTTQPVKLSRRAIKEHDLVLQVFMRIANDALLQGYFGTAFNARYVTDSSGEAEFFKLLYRRDALAMRTAALCAHLAHSVPLMSDVPISTILKMRRREPEAFENYRSTITGIVKQYAAEGKSVTENEAKEIYLDLLKPQLDGLLVQARNIRRAQLKKGLLKVAATSAVIGVGIYGGILPSQLADLCKAIGGFSVAKDLAETLGAIERNPGEIRNHNLYFLLRLKQESRKGTFSSEQSSEPGRLGARP